MQKGFYLDLTRCTSCYACVVACKAHHAIYDENVYWRRVMTLETGQLSQRAAGKLVHVVHALRDTCLQGGLPHQGHYQAERRWAGHCGSKPLHRMQNVFECLPLRSPAIRQEWKDAEVQLLPRTPGRGTIPCLHECLSHAGASRGTRGGALRVGHPEGGQAAYPEQRSLLFRLSDECIQRIPGARKLPMYLIAIKMLVGDRGKYLGIIMGLTFASLLITQQSSIFTGLMTRTYSFIGDLSQPDIWVMDPKVQYIDDSKPLQDTELFRIRGVKGVEWAVPLYKGLLKARLESGTFQVCNVLGIDDATLIGGPPRMLQGSLSDLRQQDAIIVNDVGANTRLAKRPTRTGSQTHPPQGWRYAGDQRPPRRGRGNLQGVADLSVPARDLHHLQPGHHFRPPGTKALVFHPGQGRTRRRTLKALTERIRRNTGLAAYTAQEFKDLTYRYYVKNTGIPINFGIAVALGFLIGYRHRRSDVLQLHPGKSPLFRNPQGHGGNQWNPSAHDSPAGPHGRRAGLWSWSRRGFSLWVCAGRNGALVPPDQGSSLPVRRSDYRDHHLFRLDQHPQSDAPRTGHRF